MTEPNSSRNLPRSIGALLASFIAVVILSLGTDILLHFVAGFPKLGQMYSDPQFRWAVVYRTLYGVVGGYITARLAPNRPMRLALIGGFIGLVLSTAGAVATWNHVPSLGPHWYPVSLSIGALPTAWLGAKLFLLRQAGRGA